MNVKTAIRTLEVFEAFATEGRPMSLTELGRQLSIPVSSCFGLIKTYQAAGYVYEVQRRMGYYPTHRLLDVAQRISAKDPVLERLTPILEALRDKCGETVVVGKLQGDQVIYLAVYESSQTIRYSARSGDFRRPHANSIGKAILGAMTGAARDTLLKGYRFARHSDRTIVSRKAFEKNLEQGRAQGWYTNIGESLPDIVGVACPISVHGELYAVSIAGPYYRAKQWLDKQGLLLRKTCRSVSSPV